MFKNDEMTYEEFLKTTAVLKMLYGRNISEKFFTKNISLYYNLDNESLIKLVEKEG